jgi:hypothetical protein
MRPNTVFTVVDRCDPLPRRRWARAVPTLALRRLKLTTAIMEGDEQVGGAGLSESLLFARPAICGPLGALGAQTSASWWPTATTR